MAINWGGAAGGFVGGGALMAGTGPLGIAAGALGGAALGGLSGSKKKKNGDITTIPGFNYSGEYPYSGEQVGLGAPRLKSLSDQFIDQILERSRGEGLVGFSPRFTELAGQRIRKNLGEQESEAQRRQSAQAASQGLRGGVPLEISRQRSEDFGDSLANALAEIELADLQAKREDINSATYAQPDTVGLGAGIQGTRAAFDLQKQIAEQPTYLYQPRDTGGASDLASAFAGLMGSGGMGGGSVGSGANKSFGVPAGTTLSASELRLQNLLNQRKPF